MSYKLENSTKFKKIKDFPYEISTEGLVRRLPKRMIDSMGRSYMKRRITVEPLNELGYWFVRIFKEDEKETRVKRSLSKLLLETYEPVPVELNHKHLDGNRANNTLNNLEWIIPPDYIPYQKVRVVHSGHLTDKEALEVLDLHYLPPEDLAKKYFVSKEVINNILKNGRRQID